MPFFYLILPRFFAQLAVLQVVFNSFFLSNFQNYKPAFIVYFITVYISNTYNRPTHQHNSISDKSGKPLGESFDNYLSYVCRRVRSHIVIRYKTNHLILLFNNIPTTLLICR